ncbi:MAG: SCO family protein [Leucothrix sp.]
MKTLIAAVLFAFAGGVLLAWFITESTAPDNTASLNVPPLSDIQLTDHDGERFKLKSFVGKTVVLNFMFNGCSPVQTVGLRRVFLDHQLDSMDKNIVFLSISVAPETDTLEQLHRFAKRYGIYAKNWRLGITDRLSLDRLLQLFNAGQAVSDDPNAHLNTVFLINPKGLMQKVYTGFPISPDTIYADLSKFIEET